jgi:hypothetical protein
LFQTAMPSNHPTLTRALLVGSLRHFLAAFAVPLVVAAAAAALHTRSLTGEPVWLASVFFSLVMGTLFVFHEVVVLIALAFLRRRQRQSPVQKDLAVDLLLAAINSDLVAGVLLVAVLLWSGFTRLGELAPFLGLFAPALYGVYLLARSIREAVAPPAPAAAPAGGPSEPAPAPPRGRELLGLQIYVTAVVAILAFAALGWQQDWGRTLAIAVVSIALGRIVRAVVISRRKPESES